VIDAEDAARVRAREHDVPMTAAEEDRIRRKQAFEEQAKVRAIYEEMVLKKAQPTVVTIGSLDQLKAAKPGNGAPVTISNADSNGANGNGHAKDNGNGNGASEKSEKPEAAQTVAGD